jgi:hypothetical protein
VTERVSGICGERKTTSQRKSFRGWLHGGHYSFAMATPSRRVGPNLYPFPTSARQGLFCNSTPASSNIRHSITSDQMDLFKLSVERSSTRYGRSCAFHSALKLFGQRFLRLNGRTSKRDMIGDMPREWHVRSMCRKTALRKGLSLSLSCIQSRISQE